MAQLLSSMTKPIAVALDIAGRPDTDDAYALNSVRKAYRLLNGATFQDLVKAPGLASRAADYGLDWMDAYRLEAGKCDALAEQVRELEAEIVKAKAAACSPIEQSSAPNTHAEGDKNGRTQRTERVRERIVATLGDRDYTGQELSRTTKVHVRTIQRRLKELLSEGIVHQATDELSPRYTLAR